MYHSYLYPEILIKRGKNNIHFPTQMYRALDLTALWTRYQSTWSLTKLFGSRQLKFFCCSKTVPYESPQTTFLGSKAYVKNPLDVQIDLLSDFSQNQKGVTALPKSNHISRVFRKMIKDYNQPNSQRVFKELEAIRCIISSNSAQYETDGTFKTQRGLEQWILNDYDFHNDKKLHW